MVSKSPKAFAFGDYFIIGRILAYPHNIADHNRRFSSHPKEKGGLRVRKCWLVLLMVCICLSGCGKKEDPAVRVVTQVEIVCRSPQDVLYRRYTQPKKICRVLNYLRLQKGMGPADEDPEKLTGHVWKINVILSDGSRGVYYQHGGRYLSKKYHPWQKIDSGLATEFFQTLQMIPTDL